MTRDEIRAKAHDEYGVAGARTEVYFGNAERGVPWMILATFTEGTVEKARMILNVEGQEIVLSAHAMVDFIQVVLKLLKRTGDHLIERDIREQPEKYAAFFKSLTDHGLGPLNNIDTEGNG